MLDLQALLVVLLARRTGVACCFTGRVKKMSNKKKTGQKAPQEAKKAFMAAEVEKKTTNSTPESIYSMASFLMSELKDVIVNPGSCDLRSTEQQYIFQTLYFLGEIKSIFKWRIAQSERKDLVEPAEVRI